jgi:hypothetical protein
MFFSWRGMVRGLILRATSSLRIVGVVGSLQGGGNGIERPLRGALFQSLMN